MGGLHHIHKRKRVHQKLKPYPHENKWIRFLDRFLVVVAVVGPLFTLPQILKIFVYQNASGVSALSWGVFGVLDVPWIVYGFVHKDKPIVVAYSLWFVANIVIAVGALMY